MCSQNIVPKQLTHHANFITLCLQRRCLQPPQRCMTAAADEVAAEPVQSSALPSAAAGAAQRDSAEAARVSHVLETAAGAAIAGGPQRLAAALTAARAGPESGEQPES